MEFIEVMNLASELCRRSWVCSDCPLGSAKDELHMNCHEYMLNHPEKAENIIVKWHTEHPRKTLAQKFKEMFPDSPVSDYPNICPAILGKTFTGPDWKAEDHCGNGCKSCWEFRVPDDT